jgi:hypothetical protein
MTKGMFTPSLFSLLVSSFASLVTHCDLADGFKLQILWMNVSWLYAQTHLMQVISLACAIRPALAHLCIQEALFLNVM